MSNRLIFYVELNITSHSRRVGPMSPRTDRISQGHKKTATWTEVAVFQKQRTVHALDEWDYLISLICAWLNFFIDAGSGRKCTGASNDILLPPHLPSIHHARN